MRANKTPIMAAVVAMATLAFEVSVAWSNQPTPGDPNQAGDASRCSRPNVTLLERLAVMQKSSQWIGLTIHNGKGDRLGRIEDLVLDFGSDRVICVLVKPSGEDHAVAVPAVKFIAIEGSHAVMEMEKTFLQSAPAFQCALNDTASVTTSLAKSFAYFREAPVWDGKISPARFGKTSELAGLSVNNQAQEDLGKLLNFTVDLSAGRIYFAILSMDGSEKNLYAVPPAALTLEPEKRVLLLRLEKAKVARAACRRDALWMEMTDPAWAADTYRQYGLDPNLLAPTSTASDSAPLPASMKSEERPAAAETKWAARRTDEEITQQVLTVVIQRDLANAFAYKRIKLVTANGRVTLQGRVKTDEQEKALLAAAESVVGPGNVNNQLELRK